MVSHKAPFLVLSCITCTLQNSNKQIKNCKFFFYADDTQLYHLFFPNKLEDAVKEINDDLAFLLQFLHSQSLNLYEKKQHPHILVDGHVIEPTEIAKNLGVILDSQLRFNQHINSRMRFAYVILKMIYANRYYLNKKLKSILCDSIVTSNLNLADIVYTSCTGVENIRESQVYEKNCLSI